MKFNLNNYINNEKYIFKNKKQINNQNLIEKNSIINIPLELLTEFINLL